MSDCEKKNGVVINVNELLEYLGSSQLLGFWCIVIKSVSEFTGVEDRGCILDDGVYDASYINYSVVWQEKQVDVCSS